jgi:hypothetical protein
MKEDPFHYHRRINYKVLKETPKAVRIQLIDIDEPRIQKFMQQDKHGKHIEMWLPKSWLRTSYHDVWVWYEGFANNLTKLIEERRKHEN